MIHVCFCFSDKTGGYAKYSGTAMLSLLENTNTPPSSTCVHILHDNTLTIENRENFLCIAERCNQLVKFYNVEELCAERISEIRKYLPQVDKRRFTIGAYYRLLIPFVLSKEIEKAIYLDGDIVVTLDINELWQIDLGDKLLGVVTGALISLKGIVKKEDYFNSGVMLMNLKALRDEEALVKTGLKFFSENPQQLRWADQCLLNYCFSTRTLKIPKKFNYHLNHVSVRSESVEKKIYHYVGLGSSLGMDMSDAFNRLWMSYFIRTPWFNVCSMGRLYDKVLEMQQGLKDSARKISALVSGKSRGFFIEAEKTDWLKNIFSIRDDEIIIPAENSDSIQKLLDAMKVSKGKFIFFIITKKFPKTQDFPFDLLIKEGFVEGIDFVKGWDYLNLPLNSYPLIQAM